MKVIRLPILQASTEKDGIMLHLVAPEDYRPTNPAQKREATDAGITLLAVLATYGHPDTCEIIIRRSVLAANDHNDFYAAIHEMKLPEGSRIVAGAPEFVPPKMKVIDPEHKAYTCTGDVIYAEGETMYLWVHDQTIPFHVSQLAPAGIKK